MNTDELYIDLTDLSAVRDDIDKMAAECAAAADKMPELRKNNHIEKCQ